MTSTGSPRFASGQGFSSRLTSSSSSQPRQNQQTPQQRKPPPPGPELKPAGKVLIRMLMIYILECPMIIYFRLIK